MSKQTFPTHRALDGDTAEMAQAIRLLNEAAISFSRPTRFQLKIGSANYYPDRGTIYLDGEAKPERERGIKALLDRVQNRLTQNDGLNLLI